MKSEFGNVTDCRFGQPKQVNGEWVRDIIITVMSPIMAAPETHTVTIRATKAENVNIYTPAGWI